MRDLVHDLLRTPEAHQDPEQWAKTLLAHAMICCALAVILPGWLVVAGYALWEAVQWRHHGAGGWDCILDWSGGALGVCVTVLSYQGQVGAVLALVVVLVAGVRVRR